VPARNIDDEEGKKDRKGVLREGGGERRNGKGGGGSGQVPWTPSRQNFGARSKEKEDQGSLEKNKRVNRRNTVKEVKKRTGRKWPTNKRRKGK